MRIHFKFIVTEFMLYFFQILIGFIVICLLTKLFSTQEITEKILNSKITDSILWELFFTLIAITFSVGIIAIFQKISSIKLKLVFNELMLEMPRAIYFFGSQMTAAIIALIIAINCYPDEKTLGSKAELIYLAFIVSLVTFIYGCTFKYLLKREQS